VKQQSQAVSVEALLLQQQVEQPVVVQHPGVKVVQLSRQQYSTQAQAIHLQYSWGFQQMLQVS
jgi:hypothetical protein